MEEPTLSLTTPSTGPIRRSSSTVTNLSSSQQLSQQQQQRFSPYTRRSSSTRLPSSHSHSHSSSSASTSTSANGGVFNALKGLPGRAFGFLFRGPPTRDDEEEEESILQATGATKNKGLPTSASFNHLPSSSRPSAGRPLPPPSTKLASSSSLSALTTLSNPPPHPQQRSTHSTLILPPLRSSRALSPALSTTSNRNRSPSPTRTNLANNIASINFSSSSSTLASPTTTQNFGLTSRSPFATSSRPISPSRSTAGSSTGGGGGHPLFPYQSTSIRGSPSLHSLVSNGPPVGGGGGGMKRSFSVAGSSAGGRSVSMMSLANGGRMGSPLNPFREGRSDAGDGGRERARKKQLVWDPEKGLVSQEALDREKEVSRAQIPVPKNEAERILEVLEGMGRTPIGEAGRHNRAKPIPIPSRSSFSVPRSTPGSPYSASRPNNSRSSLATGGGGTGKGLESVLKAREERRRAALEELRKVSEEERQASRVQEEEEERPRVRRSERNARKREPEVEKSKGWSSKRNLGKEVEVTPSAGKGKGKGKGKGRRDDESVMSDDEPSSRRSKTPIQAEPPLPPPPPAPLPTISTTGLKPPQQTSMRPTKAHSSRKHETISSKAFSISAPDDLPEVDEEDLGKIKLPKIDWGSGGLFGSSEGKMEVETVSAVTGGGSLLNRLGGATTTSATTEPIKSAFTLPPPTTTTTSTSFSFAPTPIPIPASTSTAPPPSSPFSFAPSPSSTPKPSTAAPSGEKPNFFGAVLAEKKTTESPPPPSFPMFGTTTSENSVPGFNLFGGGGEKVKENPFAAFGKPIGEVVKESGGKVSEIEEVLEAPAKAPTFAFTTAAPSNPFGAAPSTTSSPFTPLFGAAPTTSPSTNLFNGSSSSTPSNMFGNPPPAPTNLFSSAPKATESTPSLFGAPAPPKPVETSSLFGGPSPAAGLPASSPFSLAPKPVETTPSLFGSSSTNLFAPKPPAVVPAVTIPPIEEADEDSGMEDETESSSKPTSNPISASNTPFAFGSNNGSSTNVFGGSTNVGGFTGFGSSTPSREQSPAPSSSLFGGGAPPATTAFGSAAPSPFAFGAPPSAPAAASPFAFGSASAPAFGSTTGTAFGSTTAPTFGGFGSTASSAATTPTTSTVSNPFGGGGFSAPPMVQTLSAPAFGSAVAAPSPFGGGGSPFNFGAPAVGNGSTSTTGFTFGSGAATPTNGVPQGFSFGASPGAPASPVMGGGFAIGSGGEESSPGKRRIAPLRRRKAP